MVDLRNCGSLTLKHIKGEKFKCKVCDKEVVIKKSEHSPEYFKKMLKISK